MVSYEKQIEAVTFRVSKQINITAFGLGRPSDLDHTTIIELLEILKGEETTNNDAEIKNTIYRHELLEAISHETSCDL
jgi:hypothetical protein